jgi:adenylate cyclase
MSMTNASYLIGASPGGRKLIAVVFIDMVGYSRLIGLDDLGTIERLRTLRGTVIDPAIHQHGGKIAQTAGDSLLILFDSIDGAVSCAVKVQQEIPAQDAGQPADRAIVFRIGINLGDVIADGTDFHGESVNIAARLQAECPPGAIYVTRAVREHMRHRVDLAFEGIGPVNLKNIALPVEVFALRLDPAGTGGDLPSRFTETVAMTPQNKPSIAVVRFTNLSRDHEQEYFCDGMVDDIITELSRNHSLLVIARNSSFAYKANTIAVRQVGRELGVRYVVQGTVRHSSARVRVSAQLVDTETGNHVWAERFDRALADIFEVQDEITAAVAHAIGPAVVDAEKQRAVRKPAESLSAWDAYARGLWHLARFDPAENDEAQRFFERAVKLDPNFSQAYQGLVYTYLDKMRLYGIDSAAGTLADVEALARQAVALDPNDAAAHAGLGWVLQTEADQEAALDQARQALELNANCALAYHLKGVSLVFSGEHNTGSQTLMAHLRLNPRDDRNWHVFHIIGMALYLLGDYAGAIESARRAIRENPNQRLSFRWLVAALGATGNIAEAQKVVADLATTRKLTWTDEYWGYRWPWMREEDHARLLDGLRKANWPG